MHIDDRARAWVRLHCAGYSSFALTALLRRFPTPQEVVAARPAERNACLDRDSRRAIDDPKVDERVERTLAWLSEPGHEMFAWGDAEYPPLLLQIPDSPPVIYVMGEHSLLPKPVLAIVGSRNATPVGCRDADLFAETLATHFVIASGLAIGIDAAAHRGALRAGGGTIAVIGTGPDRVYPSRHRDLAREIAANGVIVSEFVPGTPPVKSNFPRRNRIISGLARGVLVVEATMHSGSLITARLALEQGREVFAIPGSIHSLFSHGCHRLIRDGAKLVEKAEDVLEEFGYVSAHTRAGARKPSTAAVPAPAEGDARTVWTALGDATTAIDTIVSRTGLAAERVGAALGTLEIEGRVAHVPGGGWQRMA